MASGGIKLSGPGLKGLKELANRLDNIADVKRAIAATQSEEVIDLIVQGFKDETDPYGRRWRKRKRETKRTRGKKVLSREGLLARSWSVREISSKGFRVETDKDYAINHQKPLKKRRPVRAMVPFTNRFPKRWKEPLNEAATETITEFLTGR